MIATSVVITCANYAELVGEAIESVLVQTEPPGEIIVVDDGSTDDSVAVIERFGSRVTCVRQAHAGAAAATNEGLARTSGARVAFLDADDVWPRSSLEARIAVMESANVEIVHGAVRQVLRDLQTEAPGQMSGSQMSGRLAGSMLIARRALDQVGAMDLGLVTSFWMDWVSRAEAAGCRSVDCGALVLLRRIHGRNMMLHNQGQVRDRLAVLRVALERKRARSTRD